MKITKPLLILLIATPLLGKDAFAQNPPDFWQEDIWTRADRGFLYYGPVNQRPEHDQKTPLESLATLESLQAEVKDRLHRAVMSPTYETLADYLEANTFLLEKSERFATAWQQTLWTHPEYDHTVKNPGANFAQVLLKESKAQEKQKALDRIAQDWALVFVVQAGCDFCDAMAGIAAYLKQQTPIEMLTVFVGESLPDLWPQAKPDNGVVRKLLSLSGVDGPLYATPSVFIVHRSGQKAKLLATGALSAEALADRIVTLATNKDSE